MPGCTTPVSQTFSNGDEDGTSQRPRIGEDASAVVFQSGSNNLVPDYQAGHGTDDYWARVADPAGTISLVDRAADGGMPNSVAGAGATFVDVSGDGRYVVFYSTATNLVAGKTTRSGSVFLRDMAATGVQTIEVPRPAIGSGEPNAYSNRPTISATPGGGGSYYVTYNSKATNLVSGATHVDDVYVTRFNPSTFTVSRPMLVSHTQASATMPSNGQNEHAEISSDGTMIAWDSNATNLDPRANGKSQVYESANPFLTASATPQLISVSSDGTAAGNKPSTRPAIDRNGDEVAWQSTASNLISGDTNGVLDCFVRGTAAGAVVGTNATIRVSVGYTGQQLTGASQRPNLDGAGDKVAFAANSSQVVKGDRNTQRDVFLRDLTTSTNYLIDACQTGGFGGMTPPCPDQAPPAAARSSVEHPDGPSRRRGPLEPVVPVRSRPHGGLPVRHERPGAGRQQRLHLDRRHLRPDLQLQVAAATGAGVKVPAPHVRHPLDEGNAYQSRVRVQVPSWRSDEDLSVPSVLTRATPRLVSWWREVTSSLGEDPAKVGAGRPRREGVLGSYSGGPQLEVLRAGAGSPAPATRRPARQPAYRCLGQSRR